MKRAGALHDTTRLSVVMHLGISLPSNQPTALIRNEAAVYRRLASAGFSQAEIDRSDATPGWALGRTVSLQLQYGHIRDLMRRGQVRAVRPTRIHTVQLDVVRSVHAMAGARAAASRLTGRNVLIAVIDSGIDQSHPAFSGRIDPRSRSFIPGEKPADLSDLTGHGTHVAGIIAGSGGKYFGVAPEARLLVCKVFNKHGRAGEGAVAEAIHYAAQQGVDIINYSGGYAPVDNNGQAWIDPPWVWTTAEFKEETALREAANRGIIGIVAAGNFGRLGRCTILMPGISRHVLTVGSVTKQRGVSSFSSRGPARRSPQVSEFDMVIGSKEPPVAFTWTKKPSVVAVGGELGAADATSWPDGIVSARAGSVTYRPVSIVDDRHVRMAGTSQATPVVSGMAARLVQILRETPKLRSIGGRRRTDLILQALRVGTDDTLEGNSHSIGSGIPTWTSVRRAFRELCDN